MLMQGWTLRRWWMVYPLILPLVLFASSLDDLADRDTRAGTWEKAESMPPVMDRWFATKMLNAVQTGENVQLKVERGLVH